MRKNKFEFIIDSEFQSQIPALTDEEFQQLEENILSEGEVLSPLIVWGNILVDPNGRSTLGESTFYFIGKAQHRTPDHS